MIARGRLGPRRRAAPKRDSKRRPIRKTLLVVCEGRETERLYFDELKREDFVSQRFTVTVIKGGGGSRLQIVRRAVDKKNVPGAEYDETWCVMDIERLETQESQIELRDAIDTARKNEITLCLSNPSFEVWLLAHFIRSSQQFNDCSSVIVELNKHWRSAFNADYVKNDCQIYSRIADRTQSAIENARNVREVDHREKADIACCNSATEMYRLVSYLTG